MMRTYLDETVFVQLLYMYTASRAKKKFVQNLPGRGKSLEILNEYVYLFIEEF